MDKLLDTIRLPDDIKILDTSQLTRLAAEIRELLVETVLRTGGHLASNLGVVELTLALYKAFNFPEDKIIWDVGHQAYIHKLLSGRKDRFGSLRQDGGISGFPKREESPYDAFDTGHSSTSISAALGIARARDILGDKYRVVAVTGDGALTGGMCFEAMNDAGRSANDLLVILNDNKMSISGNVGSVSRYLSRIRSMPAYFSLREDIHSSLDKAPFFGKPLAGFISKLKSLIKYAIIPGILFEELGFRYIGPVDGHNIAELAKILDGVAGMRGPVLLHVLTKKGMGYHFAESDPQKYHGVAPNGDGAAKADKPAHKHKPASQSLPAQQPPTSAQAQSLPAPQPLPAQQPPTAPPSQSLPAPQGAVLSFSDVFGHELARLAGGDPSVVAISAAMTGGTGLGEFADKYPKRFFDVGIAEQHAITLAAGMALYGLKPVAAIYSTFLQRAYDQILHDICLQQAHVVIAIDRAGVAGEDGETHQGLYDLAFLRHMPHITIMAPACDDELEQMLRFAMYEIKGPVALRYPKGLIKRAEIQGKLDRLRAGRGEEPGTWRGGKLRDGCGEESCAEFGNKLKIGRGELLHSGGDITIVAAGPLLGAAIDAVEALSERGYGADLISARFVKPLDTRLIAASVQKTGRLLTVEDGCIAGGFGAAIAECLSGMEYTARLCGFPDMPITQGERGAILRKYGLDGAGLLNCALELLS